jgi:uncharacterized MAPEG superfamily protein
MAYVDIVTILAVLQFIVFAAKVASARGKYGIKAPATTGNEMFERTFRVQQNTLELLLCLLPALYLSGPYWNPIWSALLGVVYLVGREIYAATYVKNPGKRSLGFALSVLPILVLLAGDLVGALRPGTRF